MPIGSIIGGVIGQQGAQAGGDMAWGAANQANSQNIAEAGRARSAMSPWTGAGTSALGKLTQLLGLGELTQEGNNYGQYWVKGDNAKALQENALANFQTTPGYQFRLSEGTKALDRSAASRGMTLSGAQSKAVNAYGQNVASEEYNNYFNQLSALSGGGQTAASSANSISGNLIGAGSNALAQGGAARGSAYERGANALSNGISRGMSNAFAIGAYGGSGGKFGFPGWA